MSRARLHPDDARRRIHAVARVCLAFVFAWHGIVPKLWRRSPDELIMLTASGIPDATAGPLLTAIGVAEVVWAVALLLLWRSRGILVATAVAMAITLVGVAVTSPQYVAHAFNPLTLNLSVIALCAVAWLSAEERPA